MTPNTHALLIALMAFCALVLAADTRLVNAPSLVGWLALVVLVICAGVGYVLRERDRGGK